MPTTQVFRVEISDILNSGVGTKELEQGIQNICRAGLYVSVIDQTEG